jgi:hypothetical protein
VTFLDFKKAFDTVPHGRLCDKLYRYGVRGSESDLIRSYLCDRIMFTQIESVKSSNSTMKIGVPQGGSLSSTLFSAYTADIKLLKIRGLLTLFADDTCHLSAAKSWSALAMNTNADLALMGLWCRINKLALNIGKTKFINCNFHSQPVQIRIHSILCDVGQCTSCQTIESVRSYKYLGVIFDRHLNFNVQASNVLKKIRFGISVLVKLRGLHNNNIMRLFCFSHFQSHLNYCLSIWGNLSVCNRLVIQRCQNKAIRLLSGLPFSSNVDHKFSSLRILPFTHLFVYSSAIHLFKHRSIVLGEGESSAIVTTRARSKFFKPIPAHNSYLFARSPLIVAIRIANWFGYELLIQKSSNTMKKYMKSQLFDYVDKGSNIDHIIRGCLSGC